MAINTHHRSMMIWSSKAAPACLTVSLIFCFLKVSVFVLLICDVFFGKSKMAVFWSSTPGTVHHFSIFPLYICNDYPWFISKPLKWFCKNVQTARYSCLCFSPLIEFIWGKFRIFLSCFVLSGRFCLSDFSIVQICWMCDYCRKKRSKTLNK